MNKYIQNCFPNVLYHYSRHCSYKPLDVYTQGRARIEMKTEDYARAVAETIEAYAHHSCVSECPAIVCDVSSGIFLLITGSIYAFLDAIIIYFFCIFLWM